jgi:diguanylate cyclase (GGDEF)-like protein/PAS domain S-box-containing protein
MCAQIADDAKSASGPRAPSSVAEVLVIDLDPIDRLRAGQLVEQYSESQAIYAEDGTQALAILANHPTSVILTDLRMESPDGLNLVRAIRNDYPKVPVIVMTGHGSEDLAMEALRIGAIDYVPKQRLAPDLHAVLARALRTAIAGTRRRRCLQSMIIRESRFELDNDPELIPPLLEFVQDEMTQLDRWDSAELMRITIALDEALRNALFHGNLDVSSELRERDDRQFVELARQRALQNTYKKRRIRFLVAHESDLSRFVIRDDGRGFDTSRVHRPIEPEDLLRPSGRGLLLMKSFMDSVTFNQAGNEVTLVKRRTTANPLSPGANTVGTMASRPAPAAESHLTLRSTPGKTATINRTSSRLMGKQYPDIPLPATLNGHAALDSELCKRLLDQLHDAVVFVNNERLILYWNEAAERLTGFSSSEVIGRHCFDGLLDHSERGGCILCHRECPLEQSIRTDCPVHERVFVQHKDGRRISVDARVMPVRKDKALLGSVEVFCDATSSVVVESAFRQIREAADRDPLTGLANRRYLDRMLAHHIENLDRAGLPFSLIMSDLDHFKEINDTWGHVIGDQALAQFAAVLQNQCRSVDLVARFGGEEFVILLPGLILETAVQIAERLRRSAASATPESLAKRCLTASFGVTQAALGETGSQILSRADTALYRAKSLGRDRVEVETCHKYVKIF